MLCPNFIKKISYYWKEGCGEWGGGVGWVVGVGWGDYLILMRPFSSHEQLFAWLR